MLFRSPLQGSSIEGSPANGIPLWIAGGGEKVTLRIAARYADYTNFAGGSLPDFVHKDELLRGHCAAVGRDDAEITRSTNLDVVIGHSQGEIDDRLAGIRDRLERGGVPQDKVEARMRDVAAEYDKTEKQGKTAPSFQFMRLGYFCLDNKDCSADHLVFNRSVSLKDSFKF